MLAGFTKIGKPSRSADGVEERRRRSGGGGPTSTRTAAMPCWASTSLAAALSIDSADPSTPVPTYGHVGQLEQALHGAVLAEGPVEQGEHDDGHVWPSIGLHRGQWLDGGTGRRRDDREGRRHPACERGDGVVGPEPVARLGDADRQRVVAVVVDGPQDVGGGRAAHLVLGRAASEQHDEADAVRERHGGGV